MSKKFKKIIIGGIVATLLLTCTGGIVFAKDMKRTEGRVDNSFKTVQCDRDNKYLKKAVSNEVKKEKVLEFVKKYTPDNIEQWEQLYVDKEELRKQVADNVKTRVQESDKIQEAKSYLQDLRTKVKDGEITRKDAAKQLKEKTIEIKDLVKAEVEEWRKDNATELEAIKESKKEIAKTKVELIKAAKDEDETLIIENLNKLLTEGQNLVLDIETLVSK